MTKYIFKIISLSILFFLLGFVQVQANDSTLFAQLNEVIAMKKNYEQIKQQEISQFISVRKFKVQKKPEDS